MLFRPMAFVMLVSVLALPAQAMTPSLNSAKAKVSYSLGVELGRSLQSQPYELDPATVAKGLQDALAGQELLMEEEAMDKALAMMREVVSSRQEEQLRQRAETNMREGRAFLKANASGEGVVELPSGLQYKVLRQGDGPMPRTDQRVTVHYKGTLIDGTVFDSSYDRGQPATFPIKGIIQGWQEALQLMPAGSKWRLFIPPSLAYGERQAGPHIGPNSVLIFDVELLDVE